MFDVIIVGGGIAAFSAALFTSRRGLSTLVIGKDLAGQANFSDAIENYPGIEEIAGLNLVESIKSQAEKFGAQFLQAEVSQVRPLDDAFVVRAFEKQYKSQALILAFGKTPMDLGVPGEAELKGKGISYCATCDAPLFKNKVLVIAGIGDIAADAGIVCAKFAKKVWILSKTHQFVAHPGLVKVLFKKKNVELLPFVQIQQLLGERALESMQLLDLKSGEKKELRLDGLLVELGYVVDSSLTKNLVELDKQEQIVINTDQSTSVPGLFAAGDVTNRPYKQAVISAGEGASAGLAVFDYLMRRQGNIGLTSDWNKIKRVK